MFASIRKSLPPPKFLDAMPEGGLANLGDPLFGAIIFPVAFVVWVGVLMSSELKLQDNKNVVLELFFFLTSCFVLYVLLNLFSGEQN